MYPIKKIAAGVLLSILLAGCSSNGDYKLLQTNYAVKSQNVTDKSIEYRILPQDRLEVMLYKDPNAAAESASSELGQRLNEKGILVDTAGNIRLPLIGKVHLAGLTQTQAADKITRLYKKYLNTPSVYVEVLNKRIFVLGEVRKPGPVPLDKEKMTLFEALADVGGFTDSAVRNRVIILSNTPNGIQMRKVDLTRFDKMNYASLMLRPNDIVYVQPDDWKEFKVTSNNFTAPFETITKIAAPFVTLKYLSD
ncbi:Capsular polysaccharide biosynthesis/export periplasmic protein WcbA; Capsular polysaccharide export system protein KpsC [hydrothermal vent metagenome]|uniref:Capsular polysaccharide biosynthesis/export periplasmic protein WcbA Capsular polysaccharide export system protein KpsC n=1 Tax=hydrothermal vent metagenome TaxID=652676 RepID=A0A1W1CIR8_9ZZZZ